MVSFTSRGLDRPIALSKHAFRIDRASLVGEVHHAFDEYQTSHLGKPKPVRFVAKPASPAAIPKALNPAVDLAVKERKARELALSRAEKIYTAEEFAELLADMSSNRVEVRVYDDGICLSRTYS